MSNTFVSSIIIPTPSAPIDIPNVNNQLGKSKSLYPRLYPNKQQITTHVITTNVQSSYNK